MKKNRITALKPTESDSSPLYLQLARKLAEAIRDGRFQSHEALPSERRALPKAPWHHPWRRIDRPCLPVRPNDGRELPVEPQHGG